MEIVLTNRNLGEKDKQFATGLARESFYHGKLLFPGETAKSPGELDLISKANFAFKRLFQELDIEHLFEKVDPATVHFLPNYIYTEFSPSAFGTAFQIDMERTTVINRDSDDQVFLYLHETVRRHSYQSYFFNTDYRSIKPKKGGFEIDTNSKTLSPAFVGLNEAVCDVTANGLQENNLQLFYGGSSTASRIPRATYPEEIEILEAVIAGIADNSNQPFFVIWQKFQRALFTGDISVLRDVETVFGKGSLRKLSVLGLERLEDVSVEEQTRIRQGIKKHFSK